MIKTGLPLYHNALDWQRFDAEFAAPDVYEQTIFRWPRCEIRKLQERRFAAILENAWSNEFYRKLWSEQGIERGDVRSLDDIAKLPIFTTEHIKDDQKDHPPFGQINDVADGENIKAVLKRSPLKLHTSGGTTGKPRGALLGAQDWEVAALQVGRALYIQGARPGDVLQIPATCSLAQFGWVFYKAAHDYLGILPVTTGSGVVTPARKQIETAFEYGVNLIASFPEYLTHLARFAREELQRDVRELGLKFLPTFLGPDTEGHLRTALEELYGCPVYDNYGCNELSIPAFEGPDQDGLYVMEDCLFLEVLDTETGEPVAPGEMGNVVATSLVRERPPLIRFNVRDLTRLVSTGRPSALGSNLLRMDHCLGRSDDMVKIRGTNVYPMACLNAIKSDGRTTGEWVCVASRRTEGGAIRDELTVKVEIRSGAGALDGLSEQLANKLKDDLGLKVDVELVAEGDLGALANSTTEGKVRRLIDLRYSG